MYHVYQASPSVPNPNTNRSMWCRCEVVELNTSAYNPENYSQSVVESVQTHKTGFEELFRLRKEFRCYACVYLKTRSNFPFLHSKVRANFVFTIALL